MSSKHIVIECIRTIIIPKQMASFSIKNFNRCDFFLLIWVLYYLQGIVYPEGGVFSLALLVVNLLLSVGCTFEVLLWKNKPFYFKGFNILMLLFTIYGFILSCSDTSTLYYPISGMSMKSYTYIKSIYLSLLPIYSFYYYTKKGFLTAERLRIWGVIFLISVTLSYFRLQRDALEVLLDKGSHANEITNNSGYLFLSCLPLLVLYRKKPLVQFATLAFVMAFIVMGMKRGAIAIGLVCAVYFMSQSIRNSKGKTRFLFILLSIGICIGAVFFFIYEMTTSDYMMKRIDDTLAGYSSGRDNLYSFFWTYFTEQADFIHYLIGRGANGTLEIYYNYAHNDWLEIAVNQGLLGLIVYVFYWLCFYKTWRNAINIDAKTILALMFLIFFAKTMFSMSYADMSYVSTSVLGFALATVNKPNS